MSQHNLFTNSEIAASYEGWYSTTGRWADRQEKTLIKQLLKGFPSANMESKSSVWMHPVQC